MLVWKKQKGSILGHEMMCGKVQRHQLVHSRSTINLMGLNKVEQGLQGRPCSTGAEDASVVSTDTLLSPPWALLPFTQQAHEQSRHTEAAHTWDKCNSWMHAQWGWQRHLGTSCIKTYIYDLSAWICTYRNKYITNHAVKHTHTHTETLTWKPVYAICMISMYIQTHTHMYSCNT